jgi:hypothetical protein
MSHSARPANFLSPYYMDQWKAWSKGHDLQATFSAKAAVAASFTSKLTLEPTK